ncbi:MAG: hypothetical protein ACP5VP_11930 [Candidatus Limnocylindrales bacterium]
MSLDTSDTPTRARALRRRTRPKAWQAAFLAAFRNSGNVRASAQAAGVSRSEVYLVRSRDARFAEAWDEAAEEAVDVIEARARQLALEGNVRLLVFFLQHLRPGVYGDRITVDIDAEARRIARELGGTDEEVEEAVVEAHRLLRKRRAERRWRA